MQARWLLSAAGWGVVALQSALVWGADEVSPAADAAALQAFRRSEEAYRGGNLPGALVEMQQAYQLSQRADLLYNVAKIEDELGDCAAARGHYRQYLERVPQGEARADAEQADQRLGARCAEVADLPAVPPVVAPPVVAPPQAPAPAPKEAPEPSVDHGSTQRWVGWSLVAGGVVSGVGAAYFLDAAIGSRDAYQESLNQRLAGGPPLDRSLEADQHRQERTARILGVSSAALLVGGAALVLLAPSAAGNGRRAVLQLQPGLIAATYGQAF